ncbi:hypothetical protein ACSVHC_08865 [Arthrobacter sp. KNU-44]|uniref:hypothetical protein n=1 Tax=Arthrobacter sp. KNU-44 TaxID=3450744 RepID=UPI003F437F4A
MIRKEGKCRWTYTCEPCEVRATFPDQFRAIEACHRHERSIEHGFKLMTRALKPIIDAYLGFANGIIGSQKDYALIPPPNLPHDPTLVRDRRKWGGR